MAPQLRFPTPEPVSRPLTFLSLPLRIREKIYRVLCWKILIDFFNPDILPAESKTSGDIREWGRKTSSSLPHGTYPISIFRLASVCKQIHSEVSPVIASTRTVLSLPKNSGLQPSSVPANILKNTVRLVLHGFGVIRYPHDGTFDRSSIESARDLLNTMTTCLHSYPRDKLSGMPKLLTECLLAAAGPDTLNPTVILPAYLRELESAGGLEPGSIFHIEQTLKNKDICVTIKYYFSLRVYREWAVKLPDYDDMDSTIEEEIETKTYYVDIYWTNGNIAVDYLPDFRDDWWWEPWALSQSVYRAQDDEPGLQDPRYRIKAQINAVRKDSTDGSWIDLPFVHCNPEDVIGDLEGGLQGLRIDT